MNKIMTTYYNFFSLSYMMSCVSDLDAKTTMTKLLDIVARTGRGTATFLFIMSITETKRNHIHVGHNRRVAPHRIEFSCHRAALPGEASRTLLDRVRNLSLFN